MESRTDSQTGSAIPDWALVGQQYMADDVKGFTQVLTTLGPLAALWYVVAQNAGASLWLTAAVTVLMILFLIRGFVLLHECGHASLFRTAWLNRTFGFVFGVMAGMPQFVWSKHHAYHHATNGNWSKYAGPLNTRSVDEFRAMTPGAQRKYEFARNIRMVPLAGFMYLIFNPRVTWLVGSLKLVVHVLKGVAAQPGVSWRTHAAGYKTPYWNDAREYWHMFWNNVALLSAWAAMSWWIGPVLFFSVYLASVTVAGGMVIVAFSVQHNFEHSYASGNEGWDIDAAAIHGTSFLILPRWLHWFTANIAYHHVHHLSARIPNYYLAECHARYQHLFSEVRRIRLSELPAAMKHILWDVQARRIISVAEFRQLEAK